MDIFLGQRKVTKKKRRKLIKLNSTALQQKKKIILCWRGLTEGREREKEGEEEKYWVRERESEIMD